MSAEDVKLVGLLQPPPDQDLAKLFRSDDAMRALLEDMTPMFDPRVKIRMIGPEVSTYEGLEGLRKAWLEWLTPWASYRAHVSKLIDIDVGVLVVTQDYGRSEDSVEEAKVEAATIWFVKNNRVTAVDFYADREQAFKAAAAARG